MLAPRALRLQDSILFRTPFKGLEVLACSTPLPIIPNGDRQKTFYCGKQLK
jgi:hypothetical protein